MAHQAVERKQETTAPGRERRQGRKRRAAGGVVAAVFLASTAVVFVFEAREAPFRRMAGGDVTAILRQADREAQHIWNVEHRLFALCSILDLQVAAGDTAGAKATVAPDQGLAGNLVIALAWRGDIAGAKDYARTAGCSPAALYPALALIQARHGDVIGALATADELDTPATRDECRRGIAWEQLRANDPAGALTTLARLNDPAGFEALIVTAAAQRKAGDAPVYEKTIECLRQAAANETLLRNKDRAFLRIADLQAWVGDLDGLRGTFVRVSDGWNKSSRLRLIARKRLRAGSQAECRAVIDLAKAAAAAVEPKDRLWAFSQLADLQADARDTAGCGVTLALILDSVASDTDPQSQYSSYLSVAGLQVRMGQREAALATCRLAAAAAARTGDKEGNAAALAGVLVAAGDSAGAWAAAQGLKKPGDRSRAYVYVSDTLRAAGDTDGARRALALAERAATEVPAEDPLSSTWRQIAERRLALGDFREAQAAVERHPYPDGTLADVEEICRRQALRGDRREAVEWIRRLKDPAQCTFALIGLAEGCLRTTARDVGLPAFDAEQSWKP